MSDFNRISNNSGADSSAEPSMDEILASIRRILKEDDGSKLAPLHPVSDPDDEVLLLDASMIVVPADISSATAMQSPGALPPSPKLDVPPPETVAPIHLASASELTPPPYVEPLYEAPLQVTYQAAPSISTAPMLSPSISTPPMAAAPVVAPQADPEPIFIEQAVPPPMMPPPSFTAQASPIAPHPSQKPSSSEPVFSQTPRLERNMKHDLESPHGLLGADAADAIANSIGTMVHAMTEQRAVAITRGGLTIEDIVREEIKPLLKAWLDTYLPTLVERVVRTEIERVVNLPKT